MYRTNGRKVKPTPKPAIEPATHIKQPPTVPKLETPETHALRDDYPAITLLEGADVASWLMERSEQLLERAKNERMDSDAAKCLTGVVAAASALFYAASPLVPIGGAIAAIGYVVNVFQDTATTHNFAPIPFIRGNIMEFLQAMGDAEARGEYFDSANSTADLVQYLTPQEKIEASLLLNHIHTLTDYLSQLEAGKRFYAYRWLLRWYENLRGHLPGSQQFTEHMATVQPDIRIDYEQVNAIAQSQANTQNLLPKTGISLPATPIAIIPPQEPKALYGMSGDAADDNYETEIDITASSTTNPPTAVAANQVNAAQLASQPLQQRAESIINLLEQSGFNLARCCENQITAICGNQRGGKGTLMGLLAILAQASDPKAKLYYFTAGVDLYPVRAERVVSALSYPNSKNPDGEVAKEVYRFFKQLSTSKPGTLSDVIIVVDEAAGILKDAALSDDERMWLIEFWFRALAKLGATVYIVLHAPNLTSIVGTGKTGGYATTFKSGAGWIGCKAESIKVSKLKSILRATGEYFVANPDDFGQSVEDIGTIPDWLKVETNPFTNQPDPVRSLLRIFPELYQDHQIQQQTVDLNTSLWSQAPKNLGVLIEIGDEEATETGITIKQSREENIDSTNSEAFSGISFNAALDVTEEIVKSNNWKHFSEDNLRKSKAFKKHPLIQRNINRPEAAQIREYFVGQGYLDISSDGTVRVIMEKFTEEFD